MISKDVLLFLSGWALDWAVLLSLGEWTLDKRRANNAFLASCYVWREREAGL